MQMIILTRRLLFCFKVDLISHVVNRPNVGANPNVIIPGNPNVNVNVSQRFVFICLIANAFFMFVLL
jgi:hypothetical protein